MRNATIIVLMLSLFANQMSHIFGNVTVLRGPAISHKRTLICLSEDDGGALVWNLNLVWTYYSYEKEKDLRFSSANCVDAINCKVQEDKKSRLTSWNKLYWNFTDSFQTPMGPVFDRRWEKFHEYQYFQDNGENNKLIHHESRATTMQSWFSVRTSWDMHILLCNSNFYLEDFCYWIILGGWKNTKSVIRKCVTGVPSLGKYSENSACFNEQVSLKHAPLSATEWRTFLIEWNMVTRNITIYDTDKIIMTYVEPKHINTEEPKRINSDYYLFVRSSTTMLLRFHDYGFLYTTIEGAILNSTTFKFQNEKICIQLTIGLCAECNADVVLLEETNNAEVERITVKGSSVWTAIHGLPMWRSVKIGKDLLHGSKNVSLRVIPKLDKFSADPLWAIGEVRQCPSDDKIFRYSSISVQQDWERVLNTSRWYWPIVTCQKLFYEEHTVVHSESNITLGLKQDDDTYCAEGYIGPRCVIPCKALNCNSSCMYTAICNKNGCTCRPGLLERDGKCSRICNWHTYGLACKKKCGECYSKRPCNAQNGTCDTGCNNADDKIYVPPLCQTAIHKPDRLLIITTSSTIQAAVPMTDDYKEANFYFFSIKGQNLNYTKQLEGVITSNMTALLGYFEGLQPGSMYQIRCSLSIERTQLHSDWQTAETDCDVAEGFEVLRETSSLIISRRVNKHQLYPCPANWYNIKIESTNHQQPSAQSITEFPYTIANLSSYTFVTITIFRTYDNNLFYREVYTLEGVPSEVEDLIKLQSSGTQVTLAWKPPKVPGGKIVRYEVIVENLFYYGCSDLPKHDLVIKKSTTNTTIIVSELQPYIIYTAQVTAHNSQYAGKKQTIIFEIKSSEIPAVKLSLRVEGWKLLWDLPENCSILEPVIAKLTISRFGNAKDVYFRWAKENYFDLSKIVELHGAERYVARVDIVRNYYSQENTSSYQEIQFETPYKAPPQITNLEIEEVDTRQTPATIHLRWQRPFPPFNGKLRFYVITLCTGYVSASCKRIEVQLNEYCDFWDNHICKIIHGSPSIIHVKAYNMNVTESSIPVFATEKMLNNTTPDAPRNYTFVLNKNSIVDLKWLHPWKTGGHLKSFRIHIEEISSNLRKRAAEETSDTFKIKVHEYLVTNYLRNYSERLYLFPSTHYNISIQAVTITNQYSDVKHMEIRTFPSVGFSRKLDIVAHEADSTILVNIPSVVNDTHDSMMYIIVEGPNSCNQRHSELPASLLAQADMETHGNVWQVAKSSTNNLAGNVFIIGDNKNELMNCSLKHGELYEIMIIVTENNVVNDTIMLMKRLSVSIGEIRSMYYEAWVVPIILFFVIAGAAFYFYRRCSNKRIDMAVELRRLAIR